MRPNAKEVSVGAMGIEKRVAVLEKEVASLRKKVERTESPGNWWERIAGTFQNDPIYKQAMKLGREYRMAQKPHNSTRKRK